MKHLLKDAGSTQHRGVRSPYPMRRQVLSALQLEHDAAHRRFVLRIPRSPCCPRALMQAWYAVACQRPGQALSRF